MKKMIIFTCGLFITHIVTNAQNTINSAVYQNIVNEMVNEKVINLIDVENGFVKENVQIVLIEKNGKPRRILVDFDEENIYESIIDSLISQFQYMQENQTIKLIKIFYYAGEKSLLPEQIPELQKKVDKYGSELSRKGIQPLKEYNILYLPDSSGFKVNSNGVVLVSYKNGQIKSLVSRSEESLIPVLMKNGEIVFSDNSEWFEKSGMLKLVNIKKGNHEIELPDGKKINASGVEYYETGELAFVSGLWSGQEVTLPNGKIEKNPYQMYYYKTGELNYVAFYDPIPYQFKKGQKLVVNYQGKKQETIIKADLFVESMNLKLFFSRKGELIEILTWGDLDPIFKKNM